jgi:hypothetical protein
MGTRSGQEEASMRRTWVLGAVVALASSQAAAEGRIHAGKGINIDSDCNVESDYDFHLTERSVVFTRESGSPSRVLMRDGRLFVDDAWVEVGAADSRRIRDYERGARDAMSVAQKIGREAAQIALTAVGEVMAGMSSDPDRTRRKLDDVRKRIDSQLASSINANRFSGEALGEGIASVIGEIVPMVIGDVVGGAVRAALSGDTGRLDHLDDLDVRIEAIVEPRARVLERSAEELCRRMEALDAIDNALEYRLPDGRPLSLLEVRRSRSDDKDT